MGPGLLLQWGITMQQELQKKIDTHGVLEDEVHSGKRPQDGAEQNNTDLESTRQKAVKRAPCASTALQGAHGMLQ